MNIAVLVSGEFRDFKIAHRSWPFKNWENVDFFFSTWAYSVMQKKFGETYIEDVDLSLIMDMHPVDIKIDPPLKDGTPNLVRMIDRWHTGFDLVTQQSKKYDMLILIRPDYFNNVSSEDYYACIEESFRDNKAGLLYTGIEDGVFDTMFILPMGLAEDFMKQDFTTAIIKNVGNPKFNIHELFAEYFRKIKCFSMPPFYGNYCTTRENARYLSAEDQLNFDIVGKLSMDWYSVNPR